MKVNPVAIQTYQQTNQRENRGIAQPADNGQAVDTGKKVKIAPQNEGAESRLAVRASVGSYADILTPEEKNALDILFAKFRDSSRFGPGYQHREMSDEDDSLVGGVVDLKV